jgi:hypothetical protein
MAINKHIVPFNVWNNDEWGLFYKELILCTSRETDNKPMDEYTAKLLITDAYFKYPNYSEISRQYPGISRSKVKECVEWSIAKFTL